MRNRGQSAFRGHASIRAQRRDELIRAHFWPDPCPDCKGRGHYWTKGTGGKRGYKRLCKTCNGRGNIYRRPRRPAAPPKGGES